MRSSIRIVALGLCLLMGCVVRRAQDVPVASYDTGAQPIPVVPESPPAAKSVPDDVFATTVRPILVQHCSPCHEPGGKMYATMPFDQAATLLTHRAGTLKRFSGEDKQAIEAWFASVPQPSPR